MVFQFTCRANTQKRTGESGVVKIDLGGLDQAFVVVPEIRRQQEGHKAGLQNRKPAPDRGLREPRVVGQRALVENLTDTAGTKSYETLKGCQIANILQQPHIALQIGEEIRWIKYVGKGALVVDPGIEPFDDVFEWFIQLVGSVFEFFGRKRQQVEDRYSPGQALGDPLHHQEILRAGQNVSPVLPSFVYLHLDIGKKLWGILSFIHDESVGVLFQQAYGVFQGILPGRQILQIDIRMARKGHLSQSRLTRLPGPRNTHHRHGLCRCLNGFCKLSMDHFWRIKN